jgi:Gas vesicle protein G
MLLIDDLLLGGLRFVLDKLATVVDQEMNDESHLHQTLMEAQMRFEMGEITAEEFAGIERTVIDRLREIRAAREGDAPSLTDEGVRIGSIEISGPDAEVDVEMPTIPTEAITPRKRSASRTPAASGRRPAQRSRTRR